jgi:preprotein translocase subunit SecG
MFAFLLVVHAIIAAALVTVILMQRSEGGGLGMGGSPSGLMSARGAADFLTRATATLATVFVALSIVLAVYAATRRTQTIDTSLARTAPAAQPQTPPAANDTPFGGASTNVADQANRNATAPASNNAVPLAQ